MQALSFRRGVGYREKLVVGASGKAILAHMPAIPHELETHAAELQIELRKYARELE